MIDWQAIDTRIAKIMALVEAYEAVLQAEADEDEDETILLLAAA